MSHRDGQEVDMTFDEAERLRDQLLRDQRERDKAAGAKEEIDRRLKEEYGCNSVEEAERLIKKDKKSLLKLEAMIEEDKEALEEIRRDHP